MNLLLITSFGRTKVLWGARLKTASTLMWRRPFDPGLYGRSSDERERQIERRGDGQG